MTPGRDNNLTGQSVGTYSIVSLIDRGGMADVYLATHNGLRRSEVLKILASRYAADPEFVERFQREAQAMSRMSHPNIVQIYNTGKAPGGRPYFAMQYAPQGTVAQKLEGTTNQEAYFSTGYALALMRQVAGALSVVHDAGFVHRDVKPSNILLLTDTKPLLADMGIAVNRDERRLTRENILLGTPDYMSPEQAESAVLDGRNDIFSAGIILYELLSGLRPFSADNDWTVIHRVINEDPVPLKELRPDLSKETLAVVERCMQKNPDNRYQSAGQLIVALDGALIAEGETVSVTPAGVWIWEPSTGRYVRSEKDVQEDIDAVVRKRKRQRFILSTFVVALALLLVWVFVLKPAPWPSEGSAPQPTVAKAIEETSAEVKVSAGEEVIIAAATKTPFPTSTLAISEDAADGTLPEKEQETPQVTPATATASVTPIQKQATPTRRLTATAESPQDEAQEVRLRTTAPVYYYSGPGSSFELLGSLLEGSVLEAIARSPGGNWYLAQLEDGSRGWLPARYMVFESAATIDDIDAAATIPAQPTATATENVIVHTDVMGAVSRLNPSCAQPGKYRPGGEVTFSWLVSGDPHPDTVLGVVIDPGSKLLSGAGNSGGSWSLKAPVQQFDQGEHNYRWRVWLLDDQGVPVEPVSTVACIGIERGGGGSEPEKPPASRN